MFGVNVETIDFNLPVDALTEKPLFAFSCNRHIRENYRDQLLLADDDSSITIDNLSSKVGSKVKGIFDQKARYGHQQHDATANGNVYLRSDSSHYYLEFDGSSYFTLPIQQYLTKDVGVLVVCDPDIPTTTEIFNTEYNFPATNTIFNAPYPQIRVINKWNPHIVSGNNYDLVQVQITDGVLTNMKFGNTSASPNPSQWIGLGGGRGVDWEVLHSTPVVSGGGRAPIFSGLNATHELTFDVGTAYMRFAYYKLTDKQKLFGGIDSPEVGIDGYVGNFADEIRIDNVTGSTGKAVRSDNIGGALTSCMIGKDSTHYFTGKLYEMVVTDFEIQPDSISQIFDDWRNYYSLT